jgi:hypothetical protein
VEYVDRKYDPPIQIVRTHQHNINSEELQAARHLKTELQRGARQIKNSTTQKTKERWRGKRMYGQFPLSLNEKLVDKEQSYRWLKSEDIEGETESTIAAVQD